MGVRLSVKEIGVGEKWLYEQLWDGENDGVGNKVGGVNDYRCLTLAAFPRSLMAYSIIRSNLGREWQHIILHLVS